MKGVEVIADLIRKNRSCRRFYQDHPVDLETLKELVNLGRISASAANLQPLKYILLCKPEINEAIFPLLGWAGYLKSWPGPEPGERPSAYIIVLGDTEIANTFGCDHGIASQSILLGAREMELAGCMIGSIKRTPLRELLEIPEQLKILLVLAIGKPREKAVIDPVASGGSIEYWRDESGNHHVPKRSLEESVFGFYE